MQVEVTTDEHIDGTGGLVSETEREVEAVLARHRDWVTRVEVHFADENATKGGPDDKRCTVEARAGGRPPVAVTHHAASTTAALRGALQKLATLLERQADKRDDRKGGPSIRHLEVDEGRAGS